MNDRALPENVRKFVFECIDSVEILEILLILSADPARNWTADSLSAETRGSPTSVANRLQRLKKLGLAKLNSTTPPTFTYGPNDPALHATIAGLATEYALRRHRVLELIFNPVKQARAISDAFKLKDGEGE